jgi:hypothetical protein
MSYKRVITKKGQELWYKDGKLTAKKYVPQEEIENQNKASIKEVSEAVEITVPTPAWDTSGCLVCGGPVEYQRFATIDDEAVTIKLCGDCYYTRTLGEMIGKIKKMKGA